jgi:hypothetical protein
MILSIDINRMTRKIKTSVIAKKPKHLALPWAQRVVVNAAKPIETVKRLELISVDVGTTTRVRLAVDHEIPGLPKHWFVKLPSLSLRAKVITALPRLLPTEVRFYNELAEHVPLNKPKVLAARSRFGLGSTLVLADVNEAGGVPGKAGEGLTAQQAWAVVEHLAKFHIAMADKAQRDQSLRWLAGPVRRLEDMLGTALAVPLMKRGLRLAGDAVDWSLHAGALSYARHRKQIMRVMSNKHSTLVHHDCHPGNLFWQDGQPGFLDWQMVRIGEGISDISYFLATALEPELRRHIEMDLLNRYHDLVKDTLPSEASFEYLLNRYRMHLAYPFEAMVVTLAVGGLMETNSNLEMIRRSAQAVLDHNTFSYVRIMKIFK